MNYPPTPQRKACNCEDPCISTDDVYYAGPNLPYSGINTYNVLTEVIEKLDAIYSFPTLQKVTETGNYTTLPLIADSFVKIGGTGMNLLLDDGNTVPVASIGGNQNLQQVSDVGKTVTYPDGVSGMVINIADNSVGNRPGLKVNATDSAIGVHCESFYSYAILGESVISTGVKGVSNYESGVEGVSNSGSGVQGVSNIGRGVYGAAVDGIGVYGSSTNTEGIVAESTNGVGIYVYSATNRGIAVYGNGTIAIEANLGNSNDGLVINSGASSSGKPIVIDKNGIEKLVVNQEGELSIVKIPGGNEFEYLMADGSVTTAIPFNPSDYDLDEFTNNNVDPFVKMSDIAKPYKVYTALLTQEDELAPVPTVLENTIGNIVWSYNNIGVYTALSIGNFTVNKTAVFISSQGFGGGYGLVTSVNNANNGSQITITTQNSIGGVNGNLENTSIEIRVYN